MPLESLPPEQPLPVGRTFRHLVVFQIKLFVDAIRDILFSPLSITAFLIDVITQPAAKDSLSLRLMHLGRRSDRVINLFNEYTNDGDYTIDQTVDEVETALQKEFEKEREKRKAKTLSDDT